MSVLPLFDIVVLAVDFLKVRVHLLIFPQGRDFLGFLLFLQRLLRQVVLHRDLASDRSGAFISAIVSLHEHGEPFGVRSAQIATSRVSNSLFPRFNVAGYEPLMTLDEHADFRVLHADLLPVRRGVLALDKRGHHAGAWI